MALPAIQRSPFDDGSGLAALPAAPSASPYDEYFEFVEPPFGLTPNTRFFFWGGSHAQALEQVMLALRAREGVVVVTGATGTGKTMLCWAVAHHVRPHALLSTIVNATLGPDDLLRQLLRDFGVVPDDGHPIAGTSYELFRILEQSLVARIPQGDRAVILIDEAHLLKPDVFEQIRLLSNLESENAKLLQIVLIGLPELDDLLRKPEQQRFDQRVSRRWALEPLTATDVSRYIEHRLSTAQAPSANSAADPSPVPEVLSGDASGALQLQRVQFTPEALAEISSRARGIPRLINLLSDRSLELAFERKTYSIDRDLVIAAAGRLRLSNARIWQRPLVQASAAVAALLLLGAAAWSARSQSGEPPAQPTSAPAAVTAADTPRGASPSAPAAEPAPAAGVIEAVPSVLVGAVTFKAADHSGEIAAALVRSGLPAFVRSERSSGGYQVMIGPYLAVDEARALDEKLSALRITSPVVFTVGGSEPARSVPAGRLVSLTMEDRTTLALDARGPGLQATTQSADDTTFVADIGPLTEAARPEELEPAPGTPLVRHVSIRDAGRSDGTFIRVRVTLTSPSRASVRVAGQRVYIDFAPVTPLTPDPSRLPPMMREQPLVVAAAEAPIDSPSAPRPLSPPLPPLSSGPLVAAEVLHRASVLADRSDVKGLERLRGDVMQRAGSADQPADDLKRVLDELDRYTTQARTVQLERDARLFQRVENDRYRNAMRPILARLDRLQPALASAARRGPASTSVEQQLQTLSDIQGDVRAVAAPSAFAATHDRVQSALSLAADALTHPGDDAARKVAEAAALLNWARADLAGSRATDPPARN